jgi:hypothetical protein
VLGAKPIGTTMRVLAEVLDSVDVGTDRRLGEVAAPQLLNFEITQSGGRRSGELGRDI